MKFQSLNVALGFSWTINGDVNNFGVHLHIWGYIIYEHLWDDIK